jgi:hypothetical protein
MISPTRKEILFYFDSTRLTFSGQRAKKELYPFVAALGIGCLFQVWPLTVAHSNSLICSQTPLIALQAAMPLKDMATSTGAFGFLRYVALFTSC